MSLTKERKEELQNQFGKHAGDSGSIEVQVALFTERIKYLTEHLKINKKDHSSHRGLMAVLSNRRRSLDYLKRCDEERYKKLVQELGLKK